MLELQPRQLALNVSFGLENICCYQDFDLLMGNMGSPATEKGTARPPGCPGTETPEEKIKKVAEKWSDVDLLVPRKVTFLCC